MKEPKAIPPRESFNIPFIEWAEKGNPQGLHKNLFIEQCNGERLDAHTASVAISKNCNFTSGGRPFLPVVIPSNTGQKLIGVPLLNVKTLNYGLTFQYFKMEN